MATKQKDAATTTDVAVQTNTGAIAAYNYGDAAGEGFEDTSSSDLSIPFLHILQSNSPQVEDENLPDAKAGLFFNTVTSEISSGANFLPCFKQDAYVEWVPRIKGGGFVAMHMPESDVVKAAMPQDGSRAMGKIELPNGNELVETHYVYGLLLDDAGTSSTGFAVLALTSTKIKPYRDFLTAMYMVKGKPQIYAFRAKLATVKQKNDKGSYYNFSITPMRKTWVESLINPVEEGELLAQAREFREMVSSGSAKANFEQQNAAGGDTASAGGGKADLNGEDPPF